MPPILPGGEARSPAHVPTLAVAFALAGCQTTGGRFCDSAQAIRPTVAEIQAMSYETQNQILAHNKTGAAQCGWKAAQ